MRRGETGRYEVTSTGEEQVRAFVPTPLPPVPPLALEGDLQRGFWSLWIAPSVIPLSLAVKEQTAAYTRRRGRARSSGSS